MMHALPEIAPRPRLTSTAPRQVSIRALLEWTFAAEKAQLQFDQIEAVIGQARPVSSDYIIARHAELGCRVDGGGRSLPHHDAEIVAATLAGLPQAHGGPRMAIWIAELARAGQVPDWRRDDRLRVEPRAWRNTCNGRHAEKEVLREETYTHRGVVRRFESVWCPIRYVNDAAQVAAMRRAWLDWRGALMELRDSLRVARLLTCHDLTDTLPPMTPWKNGY